MLKPDNILNANGVKVSQYLMTIHNPNRVQMPGKMAKPEYITIHNTDDLKNISDDAEQYARATVNGNMGGVMVHYYVDENGAWQLLPHDVAGFHAADGNGDGNRKSIAIECVMNDVNYKHDATSEDNTARLAAWLLVKYNLGIDRLRTHTYWLHNCRKNGYGITGSVDKMNTTKHPYKTCPAYIIPHWEKFKNTVQEYMNVIQKNNQFISGDSEMAQEQPTPPTADEFRVKILDDALNIRTAPGLHTDLVGRITDHGVYTIVQTADADGIPWGKLKSGAGWISLNEKYKM